jgi:phage-related protein
VRADTLSVTRAAGPPLPGSGVEPEDLHLRVHALEECAVPIVVTLAWIFDVNQGRIEKSPKWSYRLETPALRAPAAWPCAALDGRTEISTLSRLPPAPKLGCRFFRTEQAHEPVRKRLKSLPVEATKEIGADIERVQWQWPVSKPLVDGLGGLYEVRTKADRIQYRVLFCIAGNTMVLLHGFVKKARTEPDDIALGRRRQRQIAQEDIP